MRYGFCLIKPRSFSWKRALPDFSYRSRKFSLHLGYSSRICLRATLALRAPIQSGTQHTTLRHSIASNKSHRILTMYPSGPTFVIPLGPTNPSLINIAKETLVFRRAGLSPALRLLVPTFLLLCAPELVALLLHCSTENSPTAHFVRRQNKPSASVLCLSPDHLRRGISR